MPKRLAPIPPGEILKEEFMTPYGLSASRLGREIDVPHNRILEIVAGERSITADTALRLGRYFGTGPEFWLNLQMHYDLETARRELEPAIRRRVRPIGRAA